MKFFIEDFFSKCDQIRRNLGIWPHLLTESLMENFIFCAVVILSISWSDFVCKWLPFLKSKKQRVFLNGQHSSWGDVLAGVLFISMIYLMVFSVTQNCLQMIPHCLQQCIILTKQQIIWIMTWPKSRNRLSIRKWALIQIFLGRLMNITFFPQKVYNIPYSFNF